METPRCLLNALDQMLDDPDNDTAVATAAECYTGQIDATDESMTDGFECRVDGCLVNCRMHSWHNEGFGQLTQTLNATDGPCAEDAFVDVPKTVVTQFLLNQHED